MGRGRVGWGPLWSLGDQKKKKTKSNRVTCICRCLCDVEQLNADWLLSTPHPRRFPCFATFQNSTTRLLDPTNSQPMANPVAARRMHLCVRHPHPSIPKASSTQLTNLFTFSRYF